MAKTYFKLTWWQWLLVVGVALYEAWATGSGVENPTTFGFAATAVVLGCVLYGVALVVAMVTRTTRARLTKWRSAAN